MSTKRKAPTKISHPVARQSAKAPLKSGINESDTAVSTINAGRPSVESSTQQVIEISSDSGSSEYEDSDDQDEDPAAVAKTLQDDEHPEGVNREGEGKTWGDHGISYVQNGDIDADLPSPNPPTEAEADSDQEPSAPTFGDLVRANETIDVPAALPPQPGSPRTAPGKQLAPPSLASLGTVLTQALRTDDVDLLESCLHTTDLATVRNTIQRLDSTLASTLLSKLAARMHRRPGRAGSLMSWVQWTLVAHGGALATQRGLMKQLGELNRVLEERSRGLNSLLALKGKLDLLEAQMQLRRRMQHNAGLDAKDDGEEDDEGVVYVEGQEDDVEMADGGLDDEDDRFPVTNGVADDDSEEEDESSDEEDSEEEPEGAEEPVDENEINYEDVESLDEEEDSEAEAPPPAKRSRPLLSRGRG